MKKKIITFNENIKSDFVLEEVDKQDLWKVYQDIFNHLKYEDAEFYVFTNEELFANDEDFLILIDNDFHWIDKSKLQFICTKKFIENLTINKISKQRWELSRNEHRSSGVEIILQNEADKLNGK